MTVSWALVAVIAGLQLGKQTPQATPKPVIPVQPEFELRFMDESTVRATLLDGTIMVATKYGKLTIPVAEVRKIELGVRYPDGLEDKIRKAVTDLGAKEFAVREAAEKSLLATQEYALPAIRQAVKSSDPDVVRRAEALLKAIKEKLPEDRQEPKMYDTVETAEFTFQGKVETVAMKAKTKYFAETSLKVAELRGLRAAGIESNDSVSLDVALYGKPNDATWMVTKFDVVAGRPLEIAISGQIDLYPQQAGQYFTGPNGQPQHGTGTPIIGASGRNYQYSSGTVVGKIGVNGEPFLIGLGTKNPRITGSGKLYLKVASPPWGNVPSGNYKVTVKAGG